MVQYAKWKKYKGRGGSLSLYGYVHKSPAVFAVFLRMAKSFDSSFEFNQITNDDSFLRQLMASVFFATGFDITAFASLIKSKKMTTFSIQNVAQYAFDISSIIDLLIDQLEDLLTPDLWEVICNFAHPPAFQKFLSRRCPSNRNKFLSTLDSSARLFEQQHFIQIADHSDTIPNGNRRQFSELRQSEDSQSYRRQDSQNRSKQINFVGKEERQVKTAVCSKCFTPGHTASGCLLEFCASCLGKGEPFMHSDIQCPFAPKFSAFHQSDSDTDYDF